MIRDEQKIKYGRGLMALSLCSLIFYVVLAFILITFDIAIEWSKVNFLNNLIILAFMFSVFMIGWGGGYDKKETGQVQCKKEVR